MRRWTLLVVPHDSEAPRSYRVTERVLRVAGVAAAALLLVAAFGVGSIIARLGRRAGATVGTTTMGSAPPSPRDSTVILLGGRVDSLRSVVDSISALDDSLSRATGALRSTDSLLTRARAVSLRMRALDSTARSTPGLR